MIRAAIRLCSRRWQIVLAVVALAALAGIASFNRLPMDAIPDLSDTQVIVSAAWPGRGPQLLDQQVTAPLATALRALPGVRYARGLSMVGDAFVYVVFEDGTSAAAARSRVSEGLAAIRDRLPEGVTASLGPDASSVGWVYEYALVDSTGRLSLTDLRALQDWTFRLRLQSVPGVAEVASVGGFVPRYEVSLDPQRLVAFRIPLSEVAEAVRRSNHDVVSGVLEIAGQEQLVTARGQALTPRDLAELPVRTGAHGATVRLGDLGDVHVGGEPRRGIADLNGRGEVVGGIVVMRQHENALKVVEHLKERIGEIRRELPAGVGLVTTYDRSEIVRQSLATLGRDLVIEMVVVGLVILVGLGSLRSAFIPTLTLPIATLLAFIPLAVGNSSANIMSLGGIAIAIGAMVDATIIMVENVHKRLEQSATQVSAEGRAHVMESALSEVGRPLFFALLVMAASFLPLLGLEGTEGRIFRPLVLTKTYSVLFSALLALTLTPALATRLVPKRIRPEFGSKFAEGLAAAYARIVRASLRRPKRVLLVAVVVLGASVPPFLWLGHEFMPAIDEGDLLYMPSGPAGIGGQLAAETLRRQDSLLAGLSEVATVFGKAGRAATATDPAPLSMFETIVTLKPHSRLARGAARDRLLEKLDRLVATPGFAGLWWMPIQTRNEMLATGVRSPVGIKVFGPTAASIESLSARIVPVVRNVTGVQGAYAEQLRLSSGLDVQVDPERAALAGLSVDDVQEALSAAIAGVPVGQVYQGRARINVALTLAGDRKEAGAGLEHLPLVSASGAIVELGQLISSHWHDAPVMVQEEDGELFGLVNIDVFGRGAVDVAVAARQAVERSVVLPRGSHLEWTGQYRDYQRARSRLLSLLSLAIVVIVVLLYWNLRSRVDTALVLLAVPFSLTGAAWLLWLLHFHISVAAWVGILALAGLDAETGTVMLLYIRLAISEMRETGRPMSSVDLDEAITVGASRRLRPKLMTASAIFFGLLPILFEPGPGSEFLKRVAAPMAGGIVTSFLMELLLYPCLYRIAHRSAAFSGRIVKQPESAATLV